MKAYSQDLRLRVLRAIDAGASQSQVAEQFAVSTATIKRYLKQRRKPVMSSQRRFQAVPTGAALQAHLLAQLQAYPDLRREEHCRLFQDGYGLQVSPASITRAREALGWT
ncbi:transposase [Thermosporothrix hazakensis]|jgi:transposase|uniref:Transposase n=1 Tax=Thermosporothrix hazakensis TaxID=644383 RepID=A0A326U6V4_THEHA|nr:IS630 transposase-related protein [Thermosporothrix hazakensis]PZW28341.1 transposase [Thermosporothrix hazakensis]GCE46300.1 hypothetical protein KTH_11690 [Thermosporothrix hazakensis]